MVDTSKKSNRKCEHCEHWNKNANYTLNTCSCSLSGEPKNYWNCCKSFQWRAEYLTPDAQLALKKQKLVMLEAAITSIDKKIAKAQKEIDTLNQQKAKQKQELLDMKREINGTADTKIGDMLYYIDYEESGSSYKIFDEIIIEDNDDGVIFPGRYFAVLSTKTNQHSFVKIGTVNVSRFFTTPERAHIAFETWKAAAGKSDEE